MTCEDYQEPAHCEADHADGGVCQRVLWRDGSCPAPQGHLPAAACACGDPSFVTGPGPVNERACLACARRRWRDLDYWRDDE